VIIAILLDLGQRVFNVSNIIHSILFDPSKRERIAAPSSVLRHAGSCKRIKKRLIFRVFTVKEAHTAPLPSSSFFEKYILFEPKGKRTDSMRGPPLLSIL
jgi:hypothetical protein